MWKRNTELIGKVLATQRTALVCSEATGPECSCMGREQHTEVQGGTESRREDPAFSTSVPACGKSRVEESGGTQPGQHPQHLPNQGQKRAGGFEKQSHQKGHWCHLQHKGVRGTICSASTGGAWWTGRLGQARMWPECLTTHAIDTRQKLREQSSQKNDLEQE